MPTTNRTHRPTAAQRKAAQLRQARWLARGALATGVAASLAANVAASEPTAVARLVAGWSPVALFVALELCSRVPGDATWASRARWAATAVIAGIAGWISYWHMVEVATAAGVSPVSAHLLPFAVDGLIAVAQVSLGQIERQLSQPTRRRRPARAKATAKARTARAATSPATAMPAGTVVA